MNVVVKSLSETSITYKELAELLHAAFEERVAQGLRFTCSTMTSDQLESKMSGGQVLVALDPESEDLIGTVTIHVRTDERGRLFGYHEYLAISPSFKRMGIATQLAQAWIILLKNKKAAYVLSDTACKAKSSVNWHLNNGFYVYELKSYRSTNYLSYVFIKYLDDSERLSPFQIKLHFLRSCLICKITRCRDGSLTLAGRLLNQLRVYLSRIKDRIN